MIDVFRNVHLALDTRPFDECEAGQLNSELVFSGDRITHNIWLEVVGRLTGLEFRIDEEMGSERKSLETS